MLDKLFVYGTLGPGRPNEHVMTAIGGEWREGYVLGFLKNQGWGSEMGYPGIELNDAGEQVRGFVFTSENLAKNWHKLDEFEGSEYERVATTVHLDEGGIVEAYIYMLSE